MCQRSPYQNSSWRELVSQEFWQSSLQELEASVRDRSANTRDKEIARHKGKIISNTTQGKFASSKSSSPNTVNPGYNNIPEKQDYDIKSYLMMMVEDFNTGISNSLKYRRTQINNQNPLNRIATPQRFSGKHY